MVWKLLERARGVSVFILAPGIVAKLRPVAATAAHHADRSRLAWRPRRADAEAPVSP